MCPDILQTTSLTMSNIFLQYSIEMSSIHKTYSDKEVHLIYPRMSNDLIFLKPFSNELI